jgi:hypothetical protein
MKTLQIESATEFFGSKEHYINFRQKWKDFINAGGAKCEYGVDYYGNKVKHDSVLDSTYHLFYVLIIGKVGTRGFTQATLDDNDSVFYQSLNAIQSKWFTLERYTLLKDIFGDELTDEMIEVFKTKLSELK